MPTLQLPDQQRAAAVSLEDTFCNALSGAVSLLIGEDIKIKRLTETDSGEPGGLWFRSQLSSPNDGWILFGGKKDAWLAVGQELMAATGLEDSDEETVISTLAETSAQVASSIASAVGGRLGREITAGAIDILPDRVGGDSDYQSTFTLMTPGGADLRIRFFLSEALLSALAPVRRLPEGSPAESTAAASNINTKNLDLLLDVEMPVSVSFGRAQLPLKDIVKLTTGSIVELNRSVSEPVEIIVNNAVIARGEVVVVDGNFGVRIREILSKQDRWRQIG